MLIGGLWHGAAWNFVLWGAYHGAVLVSFRFLQPLGAERRFPGAIRPFQILLYFQITAFGWLLFRSTSLQQVVDFTRALGTPGETDPSSVLVVGTLAMLVLGIDLVHEHGPKLRDALLRIEAIANARHTVGPLLVATSCLAMIFLLLLLGARSGGEFIYFQF